MNAAKVMRKLDLANVNAEQEGKGSRDIRQEEKKSNELEAENRKSYARK